MNGQDIAEIVNVANLYPLAVDGLQWDLFDLVFTDDVRADFGGQAVWDGLGPLKEAFDFIHKPFQATQHATRGHHVLVDGDEATCLSYVHAHFIRDVPGGNLFEAVGWYDDALVRTSAGWRIRYRSSRSLWVGGNPDVLKTTPDVNIENLLDTLSGEAGAGRLVHFEALKRLRGGA